MNSGEFFLESEERAAESKARDTLPPDAGFEERFFHGAAFAFSVDEDWQIGNEN